MASGLAYVGRIENVRSIEGADRIVAAEVVCGEGGRWQGVVAKGDFVPGDLCLVYLQDAVVKPSEQLAFLEKAQWRVRMQRFKGVPSECVIVPTDLYAEQHLGMDMTEQLGVTKYEKVLHADFNGGAAYGSFPSFIPKTDEPNFQTAGRLVEALKGKPWYATEKADGTSTTAYRRGDHFGVCSRNLELQEFATNSHWSLALKFGLKEKLPDGTALQWETVGPGVQKNPMGLKELEPRAFSAYRFTEGRYLNRDEFVALCLDIGIPMAPEVAGGPDFLLDSDQLRTLAEGKYANGKQREGVVVRPDVEEFVRGSRLSFKVINLLYKGDL